MGRVRFAVIIWAALAACLSFGASDRYICEVRHVYHLSNEGILEVSDFQASMSGESFAVSRENGSIQGKVLPTFRAESVRVINPGSSEYSFKAVAHFSEQVQILEVQEFREGVLKPFVASSMGGAGIVTGTCE